MQYLGGKEKIADKLLEVIRPYANGCVGIIEPFCGGCSMTSRLSRLGLPVTASDLHAALVNMWIAVQNGWVPPEHVSEEQYKELKDKKDNNNPLTAFAGFGCSFAGVFFNGYARNRRCDNYAKQTNKSIMRKFPYLASVLFRIADYQEYNTTNTKNHLIYCDPPYSNTRGYSVGKFDTDGFWDWVRYMSLHNTVLVSSYEATSDFECVWQIEKRLGLIDKNGIQKVSCERLFIYRKQER